jgi:hypothetical protein
LIPDHEAQDPDLLPAEQGSVQQLHTPALHCHVSPSCGQYVRYKKENPFKYVHNIKIQEGKGILYY